MRDVKRKICLDLDMAGLMDDENGMELLVRGHIVGLDLPIHLVYEQIWSENGLEAGGGGAQSNMGRGEGNGPMEIVFRLQGLDGGVYLSGLENAVLFVDDVGHSDALTAGLGTARGP